MQSCVVCCNLDSLCNTSQDTAIIFSLQKILHNLDMRLQMDICFCDNHACGIRHCECTVDTLISLALLGQSCRPAYLHSLAAIDCALEYLPEVLAQ